MTPWLPEGDWEPVQPPQRNAHSVPPPFSAASLRRKPATNAATSGSATESSEIRHRLRSSNTTSRTGHWLSFASKKCFGSRGGPTLLPAGACGVVPREFRWLPRFQSLLQTFVGWVGSLADAAIPLVAVCDIKKWLSGSVRSRYPSGSAPQNHVRRIRDNLFEQGYGIGQRVRPPLYFPLSLRCRVRSCALFAAGEFVRQNPSEGLLLRHKQSHRKGEPVITIR